LFSIVERSYLTSSLDTKWHGWNLAIVPVARLN
jgi:hypothetical protein